MSKTSLLVLLLLTAACGGSMQQQDPVVVDRNRECAAAVAELREMRTSGARCVDSQARVSVEHPTCPLNFTCPQ